MKGICSFPLMIMVALGSTFFLMSLLPPSPHEWCVYWFSLWNNPLAVGRRFELKKGSFKVVLGRGKLANQKKVTKMMTTTIKAYKIIPIKNYVWAQSLNRVLTNKKAIFNRGCYPLTCNIILYETLWFTITDEDKESKVRNNIVVTLWFGSTSIAVIFTTRIFY